MHFLFEDLVLGHFGACVLQHSKRDLKRTWRFHLRTVVSDRIKCAEHHPGSGLRDTVRYGSQRSGAGDSDRAGNLSGVMSAQVNADEGFV